MTTSVFTYEPNFNVRIDTKSRNLNVLNSRINGVDWFYLSNLCKNIMYGLPKQSSFTTAFPYVPYVRIGDIDAYGDIPNLESLDKMYGNPHKLSHNFDISISRIGTVGKIHRIIAGLSYFISDSNMLCKFKENIDVDYVYVFLRTNIMQEYMNNLSTGNVQKGLSLDQVKNIPIYYPNQQERDRIKKEYFDLINQAKQKEKEFKELGEYFDFPLPFEWEEEKEERTKVFSYSFQDRLDTKYKRLNDLNLKSFKKLKDFNTVFYHGKDVDKSTRDGDTPYILINDIDIFGEIHPKSCKEYVNMDSFCETGDILFSIRGTIGKVGIVNHPCACSRNTVGIRSPDNNYFMAYFTSKFFSYYLSLIRSGSVHNFMPQLKVRNLHIPSYDEQTKFKIGQQYLEWQQKRKEVWTELQYIKNKIDTFNI